MTWASGCDVPEYFSKLGQLHLWGSWAFITSLVKGWKPLRFAFIARLTNGLGSALKGWCSYPQLPCPNESWVVIVGVFLHDDRSVGVWVVHLPWAEFLKGALRDFAVRSEDKGFPWVGLSSLRAIWSCDANKSNLCCSRSNLCFSFRDARSCSIFSYIWPRASLMIFCRFSLFLRRKDSSYWFVLSC